MEGIDLSDAWILVLAVAIDWVLGEPPARMHPVVWMGRLVAALEKLAPGEGRLRQLGYGIGMAILVPVAFGLPTWLLLGILGELSVLVYVVVGAFLLKTTFAVRALDHAVDSVRAALVMGDLAAARCGLRSLVSRDTTGLDQDLVAAAAVESLAENSSDSVVAPLFYFVVFGLPGAVAYRCVNTLDSMIGYHGRYEYLGKAAAHMDDLANLIPSRLSALLIIAGAWLVRADARLGWCTVWRHHGATESPNAGWPMSAMAGALRVQLEKVGQYRLGEPIAMLTADRVAEAMRLTRTAMGLAVSLILLAVVVKGAI